MRDAAVNVHAHAPLMRSYLRSGSVSSMRISESDESGLLLGSAGGIRQLIDCVGGGPVFSMNADVVHLAPLRQLHERHAELLRRHGVSLTLVLAGGEAVERARGVYREILVDESSGLIRALGEKKTRVPFFTGTAIFEAEGFSHLTRGVPAEFVPEVLEPAIRARKVGFLFSDALWLDIGSPELWHQAETRLRAELSIGNLPKYLLERLERADPTWGGRFELGKSSIRMDDMLYEIEDLRNS